MVANNIITQNKTIINEIIREKHQWQQNNLNRVRKLHVTVNL